MTETPVFDVAVGRVRSGEVGGLVVASTDILTVDEVIQVIEAGGVVAFADQRVVLSGTVERSA